MKTIVPTRRVPKATTAIPKWLDTWEFTRFITLASNDPAASEARMPGSNLKYGFLEDRLRRWDAQVNHALLGREWAKRHADRMFCFYTVEKLDTNPHWHGLVRFFSSSGIPIAQQEQTFDEHAERIWKKLVPGGTVAVRQVTTQRGVAKYIAKALGHPLFI